MALSVLMHFYCIETHRVSCVCPIQYESSIQKLRANWFQLMTSIQNDESIQIRGSVIIAYDVSTNTTLLKQQQQQEPNISLLNDLFSHNNMTPMYEQAIPIRVASFHCCINDSTSSISIVSSYSQMFGKYINKRSRIHYGECHVILVRGRDRTTCCRSCFADRTHFFVIYSLVVVACFW